MVSYASANASMVTHLALGAVTFIPVVGSAAAVADAGLYLYEGDVVDASLSMLAVVPGGELLGDAGKLARGGEKAAAVAEDVVKLGGDVDRLATAGGEFERAASEAERGASKAADGVVYLRRDTTGAVADYVGQAKSSERFAARQTEHARAFPDSNFEFTELARANPGTELNVAEESSIRSLGGPGGNGRPGALSNKRFQMSDANYGAAGGNVSLPWPF